MRMLSWFHRETARDGLSKKCGGKKCGDRIPIPRFACTAKQFKFCNGYAVDAYGRK
jgi:hypothetical protein